MTEYDYYLGLTQQENVILNERNKQLEDEKELWHKRALELKKFAPTDWYW